MERDLVEQLARFCCEKINVDDPSQLADLVRFANLVEERHMMLPARHPGPGTIGPFSVRSPDHGGR